MLIMGIDPGNSGGISIVETQIDGLPKIAYSLKMPTVELYGKKVVDSLKIYKQLKTPQWVLDNWQ